MPCKPQHAPTAAQPFPPRPCFGFYTQPPRPNWTRETLSLIVGGRLAVAVPLRGVPGAGKRMVLESFMWDRVKAVLGTDWLWKGNPDGSGYVVSTRKQAVAYAAGSPVLVLARYVAGAPPGTVVTYLDGDALNLTRGNLEVRDRVEFMARLTGHDRPA